MTDDGEAANALMHPSHEVGKTYRVTVSGSEPEEAVRALEFAAHQCIGLTRAADAAGASSAADRATVRKKDKIRFIISRTRRVRARPPFRKMSHRRSFRSHRSKRFYRTYPAFAMVCSSRGAF